MEEEEDDFYGDGGAVQDPSTAHIDVEPDKTVDRMEMSGSEEDEDEDDSDDDVQFTLEKPEGAKSAAATGTKPGSTKIDRTVSSDIIQAAKSSTPIRQEAPRAGSTAPPSTVKGILTHDGKEGKDFPESRTSKIDVNGIPTWQANGKSILEVDIDADLAENSKPWRLPGTDQTDYFNYGFDEYTWTQYCVRQQTMGGTIGELKSADAQLKAFMGGGPGGGMPGMPPGMGMPDPEQFMQMFNQQMMSPDFQQQMMQQMGGSGMGQFPSGAFGSGQNSVSPQPQAGQGFQPPSGPSGGGGGHGQQGGFAAGNMEGYSPQQMAIMQQEHGQMPVGGGGGGVGGGVGGVGGGGAGGGGSGGGGGRGRNRRGRGYY